MTNKIILNLPDSTDARSFGSSNLIHQPEFEQARKLIDRSMERAVAWRQKSQSNRNAHQNDRLHETITILGTRGSGKTTFLLSLLKEYEENNSSAAVLPIIDPTLIEEKGHIFLNVISCIRNLVDVKFSESDAFPSSPGYLRKKEWMERMQGLSYGLPSIDGVGGSLLDSGWQDPEFIMNKGIRSINSARNLEKSFHALVEEGLKILGKECLIIAFDDIDIDFKKGWPVLETIRKYFTSPQIITLLSGDLRLYSLAIRKQHWLNFGKDLLDVETGTPARKEWFTSLVTEMEGQYMQKVMKPTRRISLTTLNEKLRYGRKGYAYFIETEQGEVEVTDFYNTVLGLFGIRNLFQKEIYRTFFLSLPLRAQIQFLSEFDPEPDDIRDVRVTDVFLSDLLERRVNISLAVSSAKHLNIITLEFLLREKILGETYQLQPTTSNVSINSCLTALNFLFCQSALDNPYLIFDYFIKIGYTRNLLFEVGYNEEEPAVSAQSSYTIEGLCKTSGIFQDRVLRDVTGNMTAYVRAFTNNRRPTNGTVPLLGLATKAKESKVSTSNRIDSILKNQSAEVKFLMTVPLSLSKLSSRNEVIPSYSVYTLLGTIGEFIRKVQEKDLENGLLELSQVRMYSVPALQRDIREENDYETFHVGVSEEDDLSYIEELLQEWVEEYSKDKSMISPHLLGKISTRFFYAISSIEKENPETLGKMVHAQIIALMNAVLIEDIRESTVKIKKLNINNTVTSDLVFINNLKNVTENVSKNELGFSRWFLSCPLLLPYLNPKASDLKEALVTLCDPDWVDDCFRISVYTLLEKVSIKSVEKASPRVGRPNTVKKVTAVKTT